MQGAGAEQTAWLQLRPAVPHQFVGTTPPRED